MRKRLRWVLRVTLVVAIVLGLALVGGYWWQRPLLLTGTGYAAHNACAVTMVAGRTDPASDLPDNPLVPYLRQHEEVKGVSTSVFGALARQRAWFVPGYGCVLAAQPPHWQPPADIIVTAPPFRDATRAPGGRLVSEAVDAAFETPGTRAILVLHRNDLVAERYARGFTAQTPQLGWSMSKSVASLMLGAAVRRGDVSLDDDALMPGWSDERRQITLRMLLEMTSGLSWDETYDLGTPITRMLYLEPDMGAYAASLPLEHRPGSYQQYSSGSSTLMCKVLVDRLGTGPATPHDLLFAPLGLRSAVWEPDAAGTPVCSSYLWMTPRDWLALGRFVLNDGRVQGRALLPAGWLDETTTVPDVARTEDPGLAGGWWANRAATGELLAPDLPDDTFFARGHDGQWMVVVPSHELVIVRLGFTPDMREEEWYAAAAGILMSLPDESISTRKSAVRP